MKKLSFLFTFVGLLFIGNAGAQCASAANIYAFSYAGVDYEVVKENKTWVDAAACAVERGGFLARIDSLGEQTAIYTELSTMASITTSSTTAPDGGGGSYVWIGGTDKFVEGRWIWDGNNDGVGDQFWQGNASGTVVGGLYSNWGDEPDDFSGQDACGLALTDWPLGVASQWNDVDTTNTLYYLIEYPNTSNVETGALNELKISFLATSNELYFSAINQIEQIDIYDVSGKLVLTTGPASLVSINNLERGLLIVKVTAKSGDRITQKIMIN